MKILHVHHALYLPTVYVRELCKRGVYARSLYFAPEDVKCFIGTADYNFKPCSLRTPKGLFAFLSFFLKKVHTFDVIHFHSHSGFIPFSIEGRINKLLGMLDLRYLRFVRTRIIYSHWGCHDGRLPSTFIEENGGKACENCKTGIFGTQCSDGRTRFNCELQEKFGNHILNHEPDAKDFNRQADYHPAIIDFETFHHGIGIHKQYCITKDPKTFYIYHAVGQGLKRGNERGTQVILNVISDMKKDGYKIELISTGGYVPYQNIRFYQQQADLVIDHLYYGWYGNMARECMAQAIPVASYINPNWLNYHIKIYEEIPPIININERNLRETLEYYIINRKELLEIGERQRRYSMNVHATDKVIDRLLAVYRN